MCLLSDSMCRGVEDHIKNIQAFVHPGTNLTRSLVQHARHFDALKGPMLIIIADQMLALIQRIQDVHSDHVYFAVCAVLPRPVDEIYTKAVVKECTVLLEHRFEMDNVVFLRTHSVFLSRRKTIRDLFGRDGLHLTFGGKQRLFGYINKFLWHFCRHE